MLREIKCKINSVPEQGDCQTSPSQIICERLGWDNIPDTEIFLSWIIHPSGELFQINFIPSGLRGLTQMEPLDTEELGGGRMELDSPCASSSQPDGETPMPRGIFQAEIRGSRAFPGAGLW